MATKLEETNIAPTDNAGLVETTGSEKQPEPAPVVEASEKKVEAPAAVPSDDKKVDAPATVFSDDKKVDNATEGLSGLSLADKKEVDVETPKEEAVAPAASTGEPSTGPTWPETAPEHPLTKFYDLFEGLVKQAEHSEVYGIQLTKSNPFHTKLILQKFLRANQNDLDKAKQQLLETLKWRKEFDPVKAMSESFNKARFGGLGYVLEVEGVPESKNAKDIATFNIYGAVKDKKQTFGELDRYVAPLCFLITLSDVSLI